MTTPQLTTVGWREWINLRDFNGTSVKAKVDTGARTSALHTYFITPFERDGQPWVRFGLHPLRKSTEIEVECEAPVLDQRYVTDSGGHKELRHVIKTTLVIGTEAFEAEVTLTNRETMLFRMLLGRNALKGRYVVDSQQSYLVGKKPAPISNP